MSNLQFQSKSEFLQLPHVEIAINQNPDIGFLAHEFDRLHLKAEQSPSVKYAKCQKKKQLMQAIRNFRSTYNWLKKGYIWTTSYSGSFAFFLNKIDYHIYLCSMLL